MKKLTMEQLLDSRYDSVRRATYLALDVDDAEDAKAIVTQFSPAVDGYKVGLELFHRAGMPLVEWLTQRDLRVFLDVKLHDIPNTVRGALRAICQVPIEMVNVHAWGGSTMLAAAREAVDGSLYHPLLIGVTLLTSLGEEDLTDLGVVGAPVDAVGRLTQLCLSAGLDGVVCSAQELQLLRPIVPSSFELVVPGTRLLVDALHDQRRSSTPGLAVQQGATRIVLGRAVREAEDPVAAITNYWNDMVEGVEHSNGSIS